MEIISKRLKEDNSLNERTSLSPEMIVDLLLKCLKTTYFQLGDNFYEQTEGAAMGSPLSPIVANLYMEYFEEQAIQTAELKPTLWLCYVDDTFTIWKHGKHHLHQFWDHLNSLRTSIKFTMEEECDQKLPFLDVLVRRQPMVSRQVCTESPHTLTGTSTSSQTTTQPPRLEQ